MIDSEPAILFISGIGHTQEWERQVAFIGMAFVHDELHAQLSGDSLSYTTRPASRTVSATHGFSSFQSQSTRTPQRKTTSNPSSPSDGMSLQALDRVPIYDARSISFNPTTDWPKLANILPPFRGEVPRGSLVVVAYTCNTYFSTQNEWNLSTNVQFVVVLGTP
ncbi:hypothetical protein GALMADRAFT_219158 [Galerina marginata CBS 339.88]|uniref:Uncharacterized protein n=1 Tax=Galerina marginata (strain CBS 339.88) TaxID=685588 RepID=A0A067TSM5_GALM3|nr:hypothetical protein GALMADRAFT_219158 [Galerina marginata CBS 339.88]